MSASVFTGHEVVDRDGESVGTITDVFYAEGSNEPEWLVVHPGVFRKERLVPAEGAHSTTDGKVQVPFDKLLIKGAPIVGSDHFPERSTYQRAAQHFGVYN